MADEPINNWAASPFEAMPDLMRLAQSRAGGMPEVGAPQSYDPSSYGMRDTFDPNAIPQGGGVGGGGLNPLDLLQQVFGMGTPALAQQAKQRAQGPQGAGDPAVMDLQDRLRKANLYQGPVDGDIRPGGPTSRAVEAAAKQLGVAANPLVVLQALQKLDPRTQAAERDAATAQANAGAQTAQANAAGEKAKAETAATNAKSDAAADAKGWKSLALDVLPPATGLVMGAVGRRGVGKGIDAYRASVARRGDDAAAPLLSKRAPLPDDEGRAAVNNFYREGGGASPFTHMPDAKARMTNPDGLYKEGVGAMALREGAMPALGAAEYLGTEYLEQQARNRASEARGRGDEITSTGDDEFANVLGKLKRLGIGTAMGGAYASAKGGFKGGPPGGADATPGKVFPPKLPQGEKPGTMPKPESYAAVDAERMRLSKPQADAQSYQWGNANLQARAAQIGTDQRSMRIVDEHLKTALRENGRGDLYVNVKDFDRLFSRLKNDELVSSKGALKAHFASLGIRVGERANSSVGRTFLTRVLPNG